MIKPGMIFRPNDSRRDNRRIRVVQLDPSWDDFASVESRNVGERKWKKARDIRLDRLESRAYKLVKGV